MFIVKAEILDSNKFLELMACIERGTYLHVSLILPTLDVIKGLRGGLEQSAVDSLAGHVILGAS